VAVSKGYPSMDRLAQLQQLIADFAKVLRVPHLADTGRPENDAEHSYGLALTCLFLAPKIASDLNMEKILRYALAHDIVEIHSGDTFVFDHQAVKDKPAREDAALRQLRADWPDFPELTEAAKEYQNKTNAEARFVYTIDKILPTIMVMLGEKETFWNRHKITKEMQQAEKTAKMKHSPEALPYLDMLLEWTDDPDYFYKPE
jgi:putative hydrolase of HD superfamily